MISGCIEMITSIVLCIWLLPGVSHTGMTIVFYGSIEHNGVIFISRWEHCFYWPLSCIFIIIGGPLLLT